MAKYRKALDNFIKVTSTNRGFRTVHHSVTTCEETEKGLSYSSGVVSRADGGGGFEVPMYNDRL